MDRTNFLSIIESGNFDLLIGEIESDQLECKREIYHLDNNEKGKRELAKDVSSFANTKDGGYILIGLEAGKSDKHQIDTIKANHPFPQNIIDIEQYYNIIKDWIYPSPDVKIEWKSYKKSDKGILIITIPPQSEERKPFLISKAIDDSGKHTEILFGYAERKRANSEPKKLTELHQLVRDGLFYGANITKRFDEVTTLLQQSITPPQLVVEREISEEEILIKISEAIMSCELKGRRKLILVGYTDEQVTLSAWIDSKSELVKSLENPPKLRRAGWGLDTGGVRSTIIRGGLRRVMIKQHKILDLYRDGTLVFAVSADSDFLAWGRDSNDLKINSLALIEAIYNFAAFYELIINNFDPKPPKFFIRIKLHDMHLNGDKTFMLPYAIGAFSSRKYISPENELNLILEISVFDVAMVAYQIVQEIYLWFGMDGDMIPYVSDKNGSKIIDSEQIRNIK